MWLTSTMAMRLDVAADAPKIRVRLSTSQGHPAARRTCTVQAEHFFCGVAAWARLDLARVRQVARPGIQRLCARPHERPNRRPAPCTTPVGHPLTGLLRASAVKAAPTHADGEVGRTPRGRQAAEQPVPQGGVLRAGASTAWMALVPGRASQASAASAAMVLEPVHGGRWGWRCVRAHRGTQQGRRKPLSDDVAVRKDPQAHTGLVQGEHGGCPALPCPAPSCARASRCSDVGGMARPGRCA